MISQVLGHSQRMAVCQYGNATILVVATVVWEIFVVKKIRVTIFRELNFRFRGHPVSTKIYHGSSTKFIVHEYV